MCMIHVSVIIPVYEAEAYLRPCLDSVVNQTCRAIEILCVDDGSTDGSAAILAEYAAKDPRICVLTKENAGAGAARNVGLAHAKGDWLFFLDADDVLAPDCLARALAADSRNEADLVVFRADEMDHVSGRRTPLPYLSRIVPFADGCVHDVDALRTRRFTTFGLAPWNKLVRRAFVVQHAIRFQAITRSNDLAFAVEVMAKARRFCALDRSLVSYRVNNPSSLQATNAKTPACFYDALLEAKRRLGGAHGQALRVLVRETVAYNLHSVRSLAAYRTLVRLLESRIRADFGVPARTSRLKACCEAGFVAVRAFETLRDRGFLFCLRRFFGRRKG